jgi:hypothetical protein
LSPRHTEANAELSTKRNAANNPEEQSKSKSEHEWESHQESSHRFDATEFCVKRQFMPMKFEVNPRSTEQRILSCTV